jgi:hypothetical protein
MVAALAAVTALAQPVAGPPSRDIAKLLKSKKPSDLAWGATLAAESGSKRYIPSLIQLLDRKPTTAEDRELPPYVLDALIRLDAEVPSKTLEPLAKDYFNSVVNLAQKHPREHAEALTRMLDLARDPFQARAVARVLDKHPTPAYVSRVLPQLTIEIGLTVLDEPVPGQDSITRISVSTSNFAEEFGSTTCCMFLSIPKKFPPYPTTLCDQFLYSPQPLFWTVPGVWPPFKQIYYRSPGQVRQAISDLQAEADQYVEQLQASLIERGLLDAANPLRPRIELKVSDQRAIRLPEIAGLLP